MSQHTNIRGIITLSALALALLLASGILAEDSRQTPDKLQQTTAKPANSSISPKIEVGSTEKSSNISTTTTITTKAPSQRKNSTTTNPKTTPKAAAAKLQKAATKKPTSKPAGPAGRRVKTGNETVICEADLAASVDRCAQPLMSLIEGTVKKWPRIEQDAWDLCKSFAGGEKCVRNQARACANNGLQKTLITTFANSLGRARKSECIKERVPGIIKMAKCVEKNQEPLHALMANVTSQIEHIKNKVPDKSEKIVGLCCIVNSSEERLEVLFGPKYAEETQTIMRLYRSVLEEVLELICRETRRCNEIFQQMKPPKNLEYKGGLITGVITLLSDLE